MAKKNRRIASLKKETIRKLDAHVLSSDELGKVQGGVLNAPKKLPYTANCPTCC